MGKHKTCPYNLMAHFPEKFDGYVLAGGKSSRMKMDKAFLEVGGETFLTRAVKTLSTVCENRVKIVFNKAQTNFIEKLLADVPHIFDVYENRGALGGIHAALDNCKSEWAIVLAVDLPLVTSEAIEYLAQVTLESRDFAAIVPIQTDGRPQPLCAVYRVEDCLTKIEELLMKEFSSPVKDFLKVVPIRFIGQKDLSNNKNLFLNVNNPNDFQKLVSR